MSNTMMLPFSEAPKPGLKAYLGVWGSFRFRAERAGPRGWEGWQLNGNLWVDGGWG